MRILLLAAAVLAECLMAVLAIGGIAYGVTHTYTILAAGHSRLPWVGAVLAFLFLWPFAWLPAFLATAAMWGLPGRWRDPESPRWRKVCDTAGIIGLLLILPWCVGAMSEGMANWIAVGSCRATLRDVLNLAWPCSL